MPGSGPKPWRQRRLSTVYLRVPEVDWAAVTLGHKTEFRGSGSAVTQAWSLHCPTPAYAYTLSGPPSHRRYEGPKLMVLEETWREPLAAISDESLQREGFQDRRFFRRYWMARTKRPFTPLLEVQVFRVRPLQPDDVEDLSRALFTRLYGEELVSNV